MVGLNKKQQQFIDEYIFTLNITQAAKTAKYQFCKNVPKNEWYVYFLVDPRDDSIFYVGKGKNKRMFSHERLHKHESFNHLKTAKIKDIKNANKNVKYYIFCCFKNESDAYSLERKLIYLLREYSLTNIAFGIVSNEEKTVAHYAEMLDSLKPKDKWIESLPDNLKNQIMRVFGDPTDFYDKFKETLQIGPKNTKRELTFNKQKIQSWS